MTTQNITLFVIFQQVQSLLDRRFSNSQSASADEQVKDTSASSLPVYGREWHNAVDPWLEVARYQRHGRLP